jgi:hypothetical protein
VAVPTVWRGKLIHLILEHVFIFCHKYHGTDSLVFYNILGGPGKEGTKIDRIGSTLAKYVTTFARIGSPNDDTTKLQWPEYNNDSQILLINSQGIMESTSAGRWSNFKSENCDYLRSLATPIREFCLSTDPNYIKPVWMKGRNFIRRR